MHAPSSRRSERGRSRRLILVVATALATVLPIASAQVAQAAPLTATSTSTTRVAPGATTALDGLSVGGTDGLDTRTTLATDVGTLTITTTSNLTLEFANAWSGTSSITFSGLEADINAALASASITTPAGDTTASVSVTAAPDDDGFFYESSDQRIFEFVAQAGVSWTTADSAARSRSYRGQPGYLAAPVTAEANDFVTAKIQNAADVWIGLRAYQSGTEARYNGEARARVWRAAVGADQSPESGTVVGVCTNLTGVCDFFDNSSYFSSWATGEPNNSGSTESAAVTNWNGSAGLWNDLNPANTGNINGYVVQYGGKSNADPSFGTGFAGIVTDSRDVLVSASATAPEAPVVSAESADSSVDLSWTPPANGGEPITSYEVSVDGGPWETATTASQSETVNGNVVTTVSTSVSGLTNGVSYDFQIRAVNNVGNGTASAAVSETPLSVPGQPTVVAGTFGDQSVTVSFDAPVDNGGAAITQYTATASPDGATATCVTSPCTVNGLDNGTEYTFTVTATNSVGASAVSTPSSGVTPRTVPGVPTGIGADGGDSKVDVSFVAPVDDGGSPITGYTVTGSPDGIDVDCASSPCEITGLTNGTEYTFTVVATNAEGDSASSSTVAATPLAVPGAATDVVVTPGNETVSVAFVAPVDDGGSPITGYTVTGSPDGIDVDCASSPCEITGLTNGTEYTFTVVATNAEGDSAASASTTATPQTVPGAATDVVVTPGNETVSVAFVAPVDDGGAAVTGYTVTGSPDGIDVDCASSPCEITGLTNGTEYTFTVVAGNAAGNGASSAEAASTPRTVPSVVVVTAVTPKQGAAAVTFGAPVDGGAAIIDYTVIAAPGGATATCSNSPCTISGLSNGTAYSFVVTARNVAGSSAPSAAVRTTPWTVSGAPGAPVVVQNGVGTAVVTFATPASDGGSSITGYSVTVSPGGAVTVCAASPCVVQDLPTGSPVTFSVAANNAAGGSASSGTSAAVALKPIPTPPGDVIVTSTDTSITVTFDDSSDVVTSFEVVLQPGNITVICVSSPCVVDGLEPGVNYTVDVVAVGPAGRSSGGGTLDVTTDRATGGFISMGSSRLLDTRLTTRLDAGEMREVDLTGTPGLPDDASSVVLTVTAVQPTAAGYLSVVPCGADDPSTSNVNYVAGVTRAGSAIVDVRESDSICVYSRASTDVVIDLDGATSPTVGTLRLHTVQPERGDRQP